MDALVNTLLSFIVPVVIVVSVVVRVYGAIKGAKNPRKNPQGSGGTAAAYGSQRSGPAIRPPVKPLDNDDDWKPPELDEDDDVPVVKTPVPRKPVSVHASRAAPAASAYDLPPVPREPERETPAVPEFFWRLEARPLMQQAVILAEILGPPKGME
jgi:hypothetical protein